MTVMKEGTVGLSLRMTSDQHEDLRTAAFVSRRSMSGIALEGTLSEARKELALAGVDARTAPVEPPGEEPPAAGEVEKDLD